MALARALAPRPKVLLLDEPFGALDAKVRDELRTWLRRLHDEVHVTSLFVTHDQQEAFEVADQIVVLNKGRVEQMGPPQQLYEHPATPFVTEFLGSVNVLKVETVMGMDPGRRGAAAAGGPRPRRPGGLCPPPRLRRDPPASTAIPPGPARVRRVVPLGGLVRLDLVLQDGTRSAPRSPASAEPSWTCSPAMTSSSFPAT